jgi:hypothetical protein
MAPPNSTSGSSHMQGLAGIRTGPGKVQAAAAAGPADAGEAPPQLPRINTSSSSPRGAVASLGTPSSAQGVPRSPESRLQLTINEPQTAPARLARDTPFSNAVPLKRGRQEAPDSTAAGSGVVNKMQKMRSIIQTGQPGPSPRFAQRSNSSNTPKAILIQIDKHLDDSSDDEPRNAGSSPRRGHHHQVPSAVKAVLDRHHSSSSSSEDERDARDQPGMSPRHKASKAAAASSRQQARRSSDGGSSQDKYQSLRTKVKGLQRLVSSSTSRSGTPKAGGQVALPRGISSALKVSSVLKNAQEEETGTGALIILCTLAHCTCQRGQPVSHQATSSMADVSN